MLGRVLATRYELVAPLGQGAMGVVYRARDLELGREVAVKLLRPGLVEADRRERFLREAQAMAALQHRHIVTVHDLNASDELPFFVMEFVRGTSLGAITKPIPPPRAVEYARQVCLALECAHQRQIIHRDLKPDNVLVDENDQVKLMDFGLARLLDRPGLSQAGMGIGTCHYMAPEQVRGEAVDGRADLYALGVILFELVTGWHPFDADSPFAVMNQHLSLAPPPPSQFAPVPPELEQLILRLLAKDAAARPASARALAEALSRVSLEGESHSPSAVPPPLAPPSLVPGGEQVDATFLFTDIVGSARYWESGPEAMRVALDRHNQLLRTIIPEFGGVIFKQLGDGTCSAFLRATSAVTAAARLQQALRETEWPPSAVLSVRLGLHSGEAVRRHGDYLGDAVNRSARLMAAGHGGQILLSESTHRLLSDVLPADSRLIDHGLHRLRDLMRAVRIFELRMPWVSEPFPPLRTLTAGTNLPRQLTSFVGRARELQEAAQLLSPDSSTSLVTFTGLAGCGKTRLALQVAAELADQFPDGVWFVELAPLTNAALVWSALARVLKVKEEATRPLPEAVCAAVNDRRLLLILDNCEHLRTECAHLVDQLLRSAPALRVLATSREPLGVPGETVWSVPTLELPASEAMRCDPHERMATLAECESVRLFIERAQAARPGFDLTLENMETVGRICRQLDGIAYALELAATKLRALNVSQLSERLRQRFKLLVTGSQIGPARQRTLLAMLDWSWELLTPAEQALWRGLSVFVGGWTLEAAERVCQRGEVDDVFNLMLQLVDRSLVVVTEDDQGNMRYRFLETVREYGLARLQAFREEQELRERHLQWCVELAEEAEAGLNGAEQSLWLNRLQSDHDNLRAALNYGAEAVPSAALDLAGKLWRFWMMRVLLTDGRQCLRRVLAVAHPPGLALARAHTAMGNLSWKAGDLNDAEQHHRIALDLRSQAGDRRGVASSLNNMSLILKDRGDFQKSIESSEQCIALYRELDDTVGLAASLCNLGNSVEALDDLDRATLLYEESLLLCRTLNNTWQVGVTLFNLGGVEIKRRDGSKAERLLLESLQLAADVQDRNMIANCLFALAHAALLNGDGVRACFLLGAAEPLREDIGERRPEDYMNQDECATRIHQLLDESEAQFHSRRGYEAGWEEAVATVLGAT